MDGKYLYNRCHLIGYQLSGENANEQNLITGTRYLNVEGMLPFENMVADYVQETGNHALYRVTPIFQGTELVARGVQMEAESVEDQGEGICFNVMSIMTSPASPSTTLPVPAPWRGCSPRGQHPEGAGGHPAHPEHQLWKISSPLPAPAPPP
ncbi:MAG: DNA/RNA non-specific endonuclease [Eubacteriales bacterium]